MKNFCPPEGCGEEGCGPIGDRCHGCGADLMQCRCRGVESPQNANQGSHSKRNPHPWNPLRYNGWHEVGRDDWQPEPDVWVLVLGVDAGGRDRVGVGTWHAYAYKPYEGGPKLYLWRTWPHGMRVTHWMEQPQAPGSKSLNDAALLDWAGSDEWRLITISRLVRAGYSIREAFNKAIEQWEVKSDA